MILLRMEHVLKSSQILQQKVKMGPFLQILAQAHYSLPQLNLIDRKVPPNTNRKDADILLVDPDGGNLRRILRRLLLVWIMFGRESARKELGGLIEELRRGGPDSSSPPNS
ncbi:hypothetical protein IGI04_012767 [Brassica rapa subsp. trilocularis]|uniref:Uncharacterized protein n=1 Tax=Brassica rapa subsp. trilocularis TaxID=1813537 RepID=A0ABQ7N7K0_BRACM|nr:hypothetical protein IGI04_012767 [Brassica rapa subsp. trilocularis]